MRIKTVLNENLKFSVDKKRMNASGKSKPNAGWRKTRADRKRTHANERRSTS